jgi:HK97 family phage portal protein
MFLVQRRSLEDPRHSLSSWPDDSGLMADSGQKIDRKKAMQYSPVWRAVNLIASTVGKVPVRVQQRVDSGKQDAKTHPAFRLLRHKPNSEQTAFYFFQTILGHVLLDPGNAYAYIERNRRGDPTALIMLDPRQVTPIRKNGRLWYVYYDSGNSAPIGRFEASEVLHFKGLGYDGLVAYSVLEYARQSIGMGVAAQKYTSAFYKNSAEPRVVLEYPTWLADEDKVKEIKNQWDRMHRGLDNAHKTAILQGGMQAKPLSVSAREAQLLESLQWSVRDVAAWFGVPPHKVGDNSRTAYNSLEQENQAFLDDTVDAWFVMIEQECRDKLLTENQKRQDSHVIEFDRKELVRANLQARGEYYAKGLAGHPWLVVDDVRNAEGMNGVGMTEIQVPTNNFGAEEDGAPEQQGDTNQAIESLRELFEAEKARMVKRVRINLEKARDRGQGMAEVRAKHEDVVREVIDRHRRPLELLTGEDLSGAVDDVFEQAEVNHGD